MLSGLVEFNPDSHRTSASDLNRDPSRQIGHDLPFHMLMAGEDAREHCMSESQTRKCKEKHTAIFRAKKFCKDTYKPVIFYTYTDCDLPRSKVKFL